MKEKEMNFHKLMNETTKLTISHGDLSRECIITGYTLSQSGFALEIDILQ